MEKKKENSWTVFYSNRF